MIGNSPVNKMFKVRLTDKEAGKADKKAKAVKNNPANADKKNQDVTNRPAKEEQ